MSQSADLKGKSSGGVRGVVRPVLYLALGGVVVFCAIQSWNTYQETKVDTVAEGRMVAAYGISAAPHRRLDSRFTDTKGDLLADTPSDPAQIVDPPSLTLARIQGGDAAEPIAWDLLRERIAAAVGRPVSADTFTDARGELELLKAGKIQMMIVHAADAPYLVDQFGFIPFAVAGDDSGPHGHRLDFIVPAKSPIQKPEDIRGHNLVCTQPLSVSGYRAALAYLHESLHMSPGNEFTVSFSIGMHESVLGVTQGKSEVAAVSNDKLRSMTDSGEITATSYRVIYESEVMPSYAVGYFYNLKPEVAAKIKEAVLAFANPSTPADQGHPTHFLPVNYAKDFATLRAIDDAFEPRLLMPPKGPAPATSDY